MLGDFVRADQTNEQVMQVRQISKFTPPLQWCKFNQCMYENCSIHFLHFLVLVCCFLPRRRPPTDGTGCDCAGTGTAAICVLVIVVIIIICLVVHVPPSNVHLRQ